MLFVLALLIVCVAPSSSLAVDDVLLQTMNGKIVTGIVDDNSFFGTLGDRVHRSQFLSNFRSANPGFVSLATGSATMPPGAGGFPSNHNVYFDLVPMTVGSVVSNLFFWNGADSNGGGLALEDVQFVLPQSGLTWDVIDKNFDLFATNASDQLIPGGLIDTTSADIDPFDGIDTGAIHKHLILQLSDNDGNAGTSPPAGAYMIALRARATGFDNSDPFVFVLRTSTTSNTVRDLAADWATAHLDSLFKPPGDYNHDGTTDAADYVVWRKTLNQTGYDLDADGNTDNLINAADHNVWRANYGKASSVAGLGLGSLVNSTGSTVPEPLALLYVLIALASFAVIHRHTPAEEIPR
ncbi:MAG: hypothetical protein IT425_14865 [Pirellulales bacterium]|nr:hypothetical protein [Pirellulales bacterium]